jgi:ATP-dependent exoDNAse (exonuclease V) beta subunit
MVDMARQFERSASSFRAFVNKLEMDAERGEADEAPIVEEGTEGVRLMTVHKAKGLQFPVVILADPTCNAARDAPGRHVNSARSLWLEPLCGSSPVELLEAAAEELQREQDEAVRVAYVAATRARDLLVAPVCGDEQIDGWLSVLNPALYPPHARRGTASPAPACSEFGADSVLDRGKGKIPEGGPVRPGVHQPNSGGPAVVWWDPSCLRLDVPEPVPLRHQQIVEPGSAGAAASEANYASWVEEGVALREAASTPSLIVKTVTALAQSGELPASGTGPDAEQASGGPVPSYPDIQVETAIRDTEDRPGGRRFGALVHAMLAAVDLGAGKEGIAQTAALQQRMFDATQEEIAAAIETVTHALQHPVLRRAAAAGNENVRRETPVMLTLEDGTLAEGVVDLAFREAGPKGCRWTVVDFKTDQEFSGEPASYVRQVKLYAEAVKAATGEPVRGLLLVI